ncbi:MAG: hypothetical protein NZM38_01495 [Cytophagales bacterium]|nr:hypothetical protein [Cytophagales bacterium]MDW8383425.1 hypothetical protein [Flammeovirgaceae bacterium]
MISLNYFQKCLLIEIVVFLGACGLRLWKLENIGLPDYDACKNWMILKEMTNANFEHIFHHASPSFYFFFFPFALISTNYLWLEYVNIFFQVLGLRLLQNVVLPYSSYRNNIVFLLAGSSCFLVYSSRSIAIESLSLLIFALWLDAFLKNKNLRIIFYFGLLFTINYKTLLLIPIIAFFRHNRQDLKFWFWLFTALFAVIVGYSLLGWILKVSPLNYLKALYITVIVKNVNPYQHIYHFQTDILYYLKYLYHFEPLLLSVFLLYSLKKLIGRFSINLDSFQERDSQLFTICALLFIGMSVLQKAPRGLLWFYPIAGFLGFDYLCKLIASISKWILIVCVFVLGTIQTKMIHRHIWQYANKTHYSEIAKHLPTTHPVRLATTSSLQIAPFLSQNVTIIPCHSLTCIDSSKADYILQDEFYKVLRYNFYDSLAAFSNQNPIICVPEKTLEQPLLYLEHSEFSGMNYSQTLALFPKATPKVCLYKK